MNVIGIAGFKKTGKTELTHALAQALEAAGLRVSVVKYTHHALDAPKCDTARLRGRERMVAGIGEGESALFWPAKMLLTDMLPLLDGDMTLVEGGKSLGYFPRILCLPSWDMPIDDVLHPELALAAYVFSQERPAASVRMRTAGVMSQEYSLPCFDAGHIDALAELVMQKSFLLAGLDCGACGRKSCRGLASEIVAGRAHSAECAVRGKGRLELCVAGQSVPLNPFVARMIEGALCGMLGSLKGIPSGKLTITLQNTEKIKKRP